MKKVSWIYWLGFFLLLKLLLHLRVNGTWSFHRDELLYLALGRHLDWGYASVPPGIGFWAWFSSAVLGGSVEAVRLISTLFCSATVLLTALMAREMQPAGNPPSKGIFSTLLIGLAGLLCGALLRPAMLFMPVVFDLFYWTLLCWLFLKYINTGRDRWILFFAGFAALGFLNKYSVLIFLFALLPGLLLSRHRKLFTKPVLYYSILLGLLIVLPNLLWQYRHQFPVFRHLGELAATQFVHVSLSGFFSDQIMFFMPALPVWLAGLYFLLWRREAVSWRIFGWMFLTVLAVLLLFKAKSYYSLGAYPVLLAAGAAFLEEQTRHGRAWLRPVLVIFMLVLGLVTMPAILPVFKPEKEASYLKKLAGYPGLDGLLRWEDGRYYALPQDFADMMGWQEIADLAGKAWAQIPDKSNAAIYAENYGLAGGIEYFGKKYGIEQVLSFSDNYRYWLPDSLPPDFHTLVYVNDELGDDMPGFFGKITLEGQLEMPLSRQHGVQVYICEKPTAAFFDRIGTAIRNAKEEKEIE
ncbi:MAG TPA: glycosyltransferase family 39 protein [Saprospiraceae bacterium]|nr:glycosyltransferase family 39 protein [Saprospiraceae bacterium]HNT19040.1 glycosyltransferase family 39 protein [Saprospiraceae bacterium]